MSKPVTIQVRVEVTFDPDTYNTTYGDSLTPDRIASEVAGDVAGAAALHFDRVMNGVDVNLEDIRFRLFSYDPRGYNWTKV